MPARDVRDRSPPRLLARKVDAGVLAVRREGRTRTPRRARESGDGAGIHEWSGLDHLGDRVHVLLCVKQERRAEGGGGFSGKSPRPAADGMIKRHPAAHEVGPTRPKPADEDPPGEGGGAKGRALGGARWGSGGGGGGEMRDVRAGGPLSKIKPAARMRFTQADNITER